MLTKTSVVVGDLWEEMCPPHTINPAEKAKSRGVIYSNVHIHLLNSKDIDLKFNNQLVKKIIMALRSVHWMDYPINLGREVLRRSGEWLC